MAMLLILVMSLLPPHCAAPARAILRARGLHRVPDRLFD